MFKLVNIIGGKKIYFFSIFLMYNIYNCDSRIDLAFSRITLSNFFCKIKAINQYPSFAILRYGS